MPFKESGTVIDYIEVEGKRFRAIDVKPKLP